jgi:short-subunit dehydrogenase
MGADAPSVARAGLKGLDRNRAVVIPGVANRLGAQASRVLPRAAMRRIIAAIKL